MGTRATAWLALALVASLAFAGCVELSTGAPVPAPDAPRSLLYKAEGGDSATPYWVRVDFIGRYMLTHADGAVRDSFVFDGDTSQERFDLADTDVPDSTTRYVVDAESGLVGFEAWVCYDPPENYHCMRHGASASNVQAAPFLWAASLAWGRTFTADTPSSFHATGRAPMQWAEEEVQVDLTWKPKGGEDVFWVHTSRAPHNGMGGIRGDFEGSIAFRDDSWFPHHVGVARTGKPEWTRVLTIDLVEERARSPTDLGATPSPLAVPAASLAWTGPLPPGLEDMELDWGGTPRGAWNALESSDDFQAWNADHPDPYASSMPGNSGGAGSGCVLPDQGCLQSSSREGFEFLVGAGDGARGVAEVEWSGQGVAGMPISSSNSSEFTEQPPEEAGDPRKGRLFADGGGLAKLACSMDPGCERAILWRSSIGDEGAYAYFTWEGPPNPHVDPLVMFRLDGTRIIHLTLPNDAAERFLGPL